jgi:hypothetical protein
LAKKSPLPNVNQALLPTKFGVLWFKYALKEFLEDNFPSLQIKPSKFDQLLVYPKANQTINNVFVTGLVHIVHATPYASSASSESSSQHQKGRFDTVLIRKDDDSEESYGMSSKLSPSSS